MEQKHINMDSQKLISTGDFSSFEFIKELGKGCDGIVNLVCSKDKRLFVIKEMKYLKTTKKESNSLLLLRGHKNIIMFYGLFEETKLCLEYCIDGDLFDEQMKRPTFNYSIKESLDYIYQISEGVKYIHNKGIIHCDLKPENCLKGADGNVKIADFGHSQNFEYFKTSRGGTVRYSAPEVIQKGYVDYRIDCWSIGVILYFFITGGLPFHVLDKHGNENIIEIKKSINSCIYTKIIPNENVEESDLNILNSFIVLIDKLLCFKEHRISSSEIVSFLTAELTSNF